jgi:hypothetical protein
MIVAAVSGDGYGRTSERRSLVKEGSYVSRLASGWNR